MMPPPTFQTAELTHNAETAHRLPHLGGKCVSLHGHSWQIEVTVGIPAVDDAGIGVEFGGFKRELREWIDTHLDHGVMLGANDPLVPALVREGTKLFRFGAFAYPDGDEKLAADLPWPTVELVAKLIDRVAVRILGGLAHAPGCWVMRVHVTETGTNAATFNRPMPPGLDDDSARWT
jgi:6-pyruvoyltetrahydropterin/6-carboxytetrahydropterin synthase